MDLLGRQWSMRVVERRIYVQLMAMKSVSEENKFSTCFQAVHMTKNGRRRNE
jgi:hypothetical protein